MPRAKVGITWLPRFATLRVDWTDGSFLYALGQTFPLGFSYGKLLYSEGFGSQLSKKFLDVVPANHDYVIVFESLAKLGARNGLQVTLTPRSAPIRMIDRDGLRFGIVVGEVHEDLSDAGLQIPDHVDVVSPSIRSRAHQPPVKRSHRGLDHPEPAT